MGSIYDVSPNELIERAAVELAKMPEIAPPEWAKFVKTGHFRQRPPTSEDWWYMRSAAVLRSVYKLGPIGVAKLRTKYGGKKDRGHKPAKFFRAGGNILRKVLQQLETAQLVKQTTIGVHKGRVITPKGRSLLDKLATEIAGPRVEKPSWALKSRIVKKKAPEKPSKKPAKDLQGVRSEAAKKPAEMKDEKLAPKKPEVKKEEKPKAEKVKPEETKVKQEKPKVKAEKPAVEKKPEVKPAKTVPKKDAEPKKEAKAPAKKEKEKKAAKPKKK